MTACTYLDNATTSFPKPDGVWDAMAAYWAQGPVSPSRGGYDLAHRVEERLLCARRTVASLIQAREPSRVCFSAHATDALNQLIFGWLRPGDRVVASRLDHNSILRPLDRLSRSGVDVDLLPFDEEGRVGENDLIRALDRPTRAVFLTHASNVLGTVQDIPRLAAICRQRGAMTALDACQTAGRVTLDVALLGVDALVMSGHKALMGPPGVGLLWLREGVEIEPTRLGGTGLRSDRMEAPSNLPERLEPGTPNGLGIVGVAAGIDWVLRTGVETIAQHENALADAMATGLSSIPGVRSLVDRRPPSVAVVSFTIDGWEAPEASAALDVSFHIACRGGLHCAPLVHRDLGTELHRGAIRFSPGPFTTREDVVRALSAVEQLATHRPGHGLRTPR